MKDLRELECVKCGAGTRTEEWTVLDDPPSERLVDAWCDNPYCDDYKVPPGQ